MHGAETCRRADGSIISKNEYLRDVRDGTSIEFYDNGQPKLVEFFEQGYLVWKEKYSESRTLLLRSDIDESSQRYEFLLRVRHASGSLFAEFRAERE